MSDVPVTQMDHLVSLSYAEDLAPHVVRFAEELVAGRIIGHRCPVCRRVYAPPKGYCALDVVETGRQDEVEVSDHGVVTGFTVITPVQYYGQKETEPFVYASVLLDGADATIGGQDITGIPPDEVRTGLRVRAVWRTPAERTTEGMSNRGWGSVAGAIESFTPTGEPDVPREQYGEHIF